MKPTTPEGRLRVYIVLSARKAGWGGPVLYDFCSKIMGRKLSQGFGLSTCSKPELLGRRQLEVAR